MLFTISTGVEESSSVHHNCLKDDDVVELHRADQNNLKEAFGGSVDNFGAYSSEMESAKSQNVVIDASDGIVSFSLFQLLKAAKEHDLRRNGQQDHQNKISGELPADSPFPGHKETYISNAVDSTLTMDSGAESLRKDDNKSTTNMLAVEKSLQAENGDDTMKKPFLSSSTSHQDPLGTADIGSTSFSAVSTSSGRLTFSGSVRCGDNISLRSNSTTSTTSFAFPILASEWNESPIRMGEVDRRTRRRSKGSTCWNCFTCS